MKPRRGAQWPEAHHHKIGFAEEFRAILKRHGVEYEPKYVFG